MSNTALSFDTLQYSKKLKEAGFTEQQAEVQAEAIRELIDEKLSTKADLKMLEYRLLIKLGGLMTVGIMILAALIKF